MENQDILKIRELQMIWKPLIHKQRTLEIHCICCGRVTITGIGRAPLCSKCLMYQERNLKKEAKPEENTFIVKCDECKKTIKENVSMTESAQGGRCKECRKAPGKYTEEVMGRELVRYDTKRDYTDDELKDQRADMEKSAGEGKLICISDMIGNHERKHIQNLGI